MLEAKTFSSVCATPPLCLFKPNAGALKCVPVIATSRRFPVWRVVYANKGLSGVCNVPVVGPSVVNTGRYLFGIALARAGSIVPASVAEPVTTYCPLMSLL
ncbi:hypothetical protein D9M68_737200 [compost metagenome]